MKAWRVKSCLSTYDKKKGLVHAPTREFLVVADSREEALEKSYNLWFTEGDEISADGVIFRKGSNNVAAWYPYVKCMFSLWTDEEVRAILREVFK